MAGAVFVLVVAACARASAEAPATVVAAAHADRAVTPIALHLGEDARRFGTTTTLPSLVVASTSQDVSVVPVESLFASMPSIDSARVAGDRTMSVTINSVERQWTVFVPTGTKDGDKLPLLIVLHGVGGKGAGMRRLGFDRFAQAAGVLVAYPDALGGSWNDGRPGMEPLTGTPADDIAFLRELIARSVAELGADPVHVSIAGFSNGALMASRAACEMTDQLEAVVLVSGSGPRGVAERCKPSRPLRLMVVFGTADAVVPYDGGQVAPYAGKSRGQVAAVRELLDVWRTANGCTGTNPAQDVAGTTPRVSALRGSGCRADLVHFRVTGGGHEWITTPAFDTTTEAWRFVSARS